jgi:hypothetical protein
VVTEVEGDATPGFRKPWWSSPPALRAQPIVHAIIEDYDIIVELR